MRALWPMLAVCALGPQAEPAPVAIVGARLVLDPDTTIEKGTIVLRDGLIAAASADAAAPADAEIIDGKDLTVYAGFVDAHAAAGLPPTKRTEDQRKVAEGEAVDFTKGALAGMESANRKGVRPELNAADLVSIAEADLKKWHAGGFAVAAVAVGEEHWSGRGALVTLSGGPRRSVLLRARTGMYGSFRSYGEGYPATAMGALAHVRQTLLDARHYRELHERWARRPEGKRPPVDPSLEALQDVLDRRLTVFWEANTATEIGRAIALAEEFNFPLVIVGGAEAWRVADRLKTVPVVLSLKWPKEPKADKKKDPDDIEEDRPPKLRQFEKSRWEERVRCAVALHEAGVTFCFSTQGIPPSEILEKVQKLVEMGLPPATALSALTAAAASLFGADAQIGRLAVGRPANLTVLAGRLGDKKTKVKYVFADGVKHEIDRKKKGLPEIDVTGTWTVTAKNFAATLELKQSGPDVTGTLKTTKGEGEVVGTVSGSRVELTVAVGDATYEFEGEMKKKRLEGTFTGPGETDLEWSATRPERP